MTSKLENYRRPHTSHTTRQPIFVQHSTFGSKELSRLRKPKWTCSQVRGALDDFVTRDFQIPLDSRSKAAFGKHLTDCRSCSSLIPKVVYKINNSKILFTTVALCAGEQKKRVYLIVRNLFVE